MERQNILGMICGYYLSRFDQQAYTHLGYGNQGETHRILGRLLAVPPDSIKNWRDEFDPVHDNPRQGWHKREMHVSRKRVIEALADLSESELFSIISTIVQVPKGQVAADLVASFGDADTNENDLDSVAGYGLRGLTGFKAEQIFAEYHARVAQPVVGHLHDRRHDQCGYDFEIESEIHRVAVEVKGLAGLSGGISFTDKEWQVAQAMGNRYFLAVIRNVASEPEVSLVQNPATIFQPKMRLYTTIQVSWTVDQPSLRAVETRNL